MPTNLAHCYSTVSNMRRYGHQWYNFFLILFTFLSPPNTSLSICSTAFFLSLSSLVSISLLLPISFSLSFFLSLHLSVSAPLSLYLFFFFFLRRRFRSEAELADWSSPIWTSTRPGVVADLCSSSSTALIADLAADGWLSLVIDWSVGLGFCWRFWIFFFLVEVFGFGICWRIQFCGCSLWQWL